MEFCNERIEIIRGSREVIEAMAIDENGKAYPLTGFTEIKACFKNDDGTTLEKTFTGGGITVTSIDAGFFDIVLESAETELLKGGINDISIEITFPAGPRKSISERALETIDSDC